MKNTNVQSSEILARRRKLRQQRMRRRMCRRILLIGSFLTLFVAISLWMIQKCRVTIASEKQPETVEWSEIEAGEEQIDQEEPKLHLDHALLLLVNKDHALPKDYEVNLTQMGGWPVSVASVLYDDLQEMLAAGKKKNLHFVVCSAYRSIERQKELLDEDVAANMAAGMNYEEAYEEATRETMPPGYSEHSTGLALDIVARDYQLLDSGQERTPENKWLQENAWKYGFILRYPAEKADITGIDYEPWHFRYVGREAAKYLHENDMILEDLLP